MQGLNVIQQIAIAALPLLFGITLHEVAHGWMARRLGDKTAMMLGRLTLNPIKHIDPVGTILVPAVLLMLGGFIFGWAKPVPVDYRNLRNPKRDMALVAIAGPLANFVMAFGWALVAKLGFTLGGSGSLWFARPLIWMGEFGIVLNLVLMVLNLLPLPPLDGGRVLTGLLPGPMAYRFSRIEPYGFFILLGLLVTHILGYILWPPVQYLRAVLSAVVGL
ncbi:MAG TPA: site-2 protease family protein [Gammaproteobacteria bacterium]|nr:site-2 protease family protein [Gammaproteobacteria bacterium]